MYEKREFAFIINNSDEKQKLPTYSYISQGQLQKPQFMKILFYIAYISENDTVMKFFVVFPNIMTQTL